MYGTIFVIDLEPSNSCKKFSHAKATLRDPWLVTFAYENFSYAKVTMMNSRIEPLRYANNYHCQWKPGYSGSLTIMTGSIIRECSQDALNFCCSEIVIYNIKIPLNWKTIHKFYFVSIFWTKTRAFQSFKFLNRFFNS